MNIPKWLRLATAGAVVALMPAQSMAIELIDAQQGSMLDVVHVDIKKGGGGRPQGGQRPSHGNRPNGGHGSANRPNGGHGNWNKPGGGHGNANRPNYNHGNWNRPNYNHGNWNKPNYNHGNWNRPGHYPAHRPGYANRGLYRGPNVYYRGGAWVRPGGYWWPAGGAVAAGAALGFVFAASATWAGAAPGPNYCWYYTDASQRNGFWDVCP